MKVQIEFSLIPIGGDPHLSEDIALCEKILADYGLEVELHAMGTNIEGDWDAIMQALKACHEAIMEKGRSRIYSVLKIVASREEEKSFQEKVASVRYQLEKLMN
ncbi:MAG: hypothetical protein AXA67_04580 [Methylothermaceae bacteria B42]|nr:MAG: hypothetical protein AXA67_04580 [Methylothermaceae bacteria B42]HHJ39962.1 MTH1187 family thiamine-binding protein [Methylothermaceae bacterium]